MGRLHRRLAGALVAAFALAAAAAVPAASTSVRITFLTAKVIQGGTVGVRATVAPSGGSCTLTLRPQAGAAISRKGRGRTRMQWLVQLPLSASAGTWTATVACAGAGSASRSFQVGAKIVPAQVAVAKTGFSQGAIDFDPNAIYWGVVLANTSTVSDARNLDIKVSFNDALGRSVLTDDQHVSLIPAGASFNLAGEEFPNVSLKVANVSATVSVGRSTAKQLPLPAISNLTITTDQFGDKTATGSFNNPYQAPLEQDANIYVIAFNAAGQILGGSTDNAGAAVQPGQTVSFSRDLFGVPQDQIASVAASVDPCGFKAIFGQGCAAIGGG